MGDSGHEAFRAAVSGRVQGVGFREATRRRARDLELHGWVRNRDDGTVEVHAEGPRSALTRLAAFLADGPRGAHVDDVAVAPADPEGTSSSRSGAWLPASSSSRSTAPRPTTSTCVWRSTA